MNTFNNLVKFKLEEEFIEYWSQTAIASLIVDGYLNLRIPRRDYSLVTEGAGVTIKQGYQAPYAEKEPRRIGFRVRVRSQNEDLYIALAELAKYTEGSGCTVQPIYVVDYNYWHDRTDRDRGFRLRLGVFEGEFTEVTGAATQGYIDCEGSENVQGLRYSSGFSFKFMEINNLDTLEQQVGLGYGYGYQ